MYIGLFWHIHGSLLSYTEVSFDARTHTSTHLCCSSACTAAADQLLLQHVAACRSILQHVAACCSVLQCAAVSQGVVALCCSVCSSRSC